MELKRIKREPYKENSVVEYESLNKYFLNEIEFNRNDGKTAEKIIEEIDVEKTYVSRVWLLFASNDEKNWDCVQVAQCRENVQSEIESAIKHIYIKFEPFAESEYKNSAFYENLCPPTTGNKYHEHLYSKIGSEYIYFRICLLNVDAYLGIQQRTTNKKNDAELIIDICKNQYAEAKIAYQTLSIYWRLTSCGVDGQTIKYIADNKICF